MTSNIRIVGAAFGDPKAEKTFSGVAKYLFSAMEKQVVMAGFVSTRQLSILDIFDGLLDFSKVKTHGRPVLNGNWLWKASSVEKLSRRVHDNCADISNFNVFFQIGTHVNFRKAGVKNYCFTDMTIAQAVEAGQFLAGRLPKHKVKNAISVQRNIFKNCHGIFVNSNWVKDSVVNDYGISPDIVFPVGVGASINVEDFTALNSTQPNILFVGRDWPRKGGPLLLEAFAQVKRSVKDASLTIIGANPDVSQPDVVVLGELNKADPAQNRLMQEAFSRATVFCVPSIFEPFGICFLEAQLYGVPPITFVGQGRSDAIVNGTTGILVEHKNPEALAQALLKLLLDPLRAKQMGLAGREFVKTQFTWDRVATRILEVLVKNHEASDSAAAR